MGRTKKSRGKSKKKARQDAYIHAIIMMIISIALAVLIYWQTGTFGEALSNMLGGLFGWIKFIIPVGAFIIGIVLTKEQRQFVMPKIIQYVVIVLCVSSFMSLLQLSNNDLPRSGDFSSIVSEAYSKGEQNKGGGAIGAIIAVPMSNTIGGASYVIVIGVAILLSIFTFGIKPAELVDRISERIQESREYEEEEEELPKRKVKKGKVQKHESVIMEDLFDDDGDEKKKYDHDIPLSFENMQVKQNVQKVVDPEPEQQESGNLFKETKEEKEEKTKQELQLEHAQIERDESYDFPPIGLLESSGSSRERDNSDIPANSLKLQKTLQSFGVSAKVEQVSVGPAITRYEIKPAVGVRVKTIAGLADDIALNLAAKSIRIEAPIPGKQAVGIEVPNKDTEVVHLRDVIDSPEFLRAESKLSMGVGKDISGEVVIADIAKMPHVLIAGSTGSGKSVCINTLITSIIYKAKPSEVKLLMVDPKIVELSVYNGIPHLLIPVVTDPRKAAGALAWAVQEMEDRYAKFAAKGVRDIKGYNKELENEENEEQARKLPQIVIIIDELADLMMVASKDVENAICRLAQKARAAGMHLVIATQRPSVDVITGLIKANVPSRIAFAVSSQVDSRTILDMAGAENLLGKGDMLYYPTGVPKPTRVQGAFVSDKEVERVVDYLKRDGEAIYSTDIMESIENASKSDKELKQEEDDGCDPRLNEAIEEVLDYGQASTSFIQRRLSVGYNRAGRIMEQLEERGIVGPSKGSKPRELLISKERWEELKSKPAEPQESNETETSTEENSNSEQQNTEE